MRPFITLYFCFFLYQVAPSQPNITIGTTSPLVADLIETVAGNTAEVLILSEDSLTTTAFDLLFLEKETLDTSLISTPTIYLSADTDSPPIWLSIESNIRYIEKIAHTLYQQDSINAEIYTFNASIYQEHLRTLDQQIWQRIDSLTQEQKLLASSLPDLEYIAEHYGLLFEKSPQTTDLDQRLCKTLSACPATNNYELLRHNLLLIVNHLQKVVPSKDIRTPISWNNFWLLAGLLLLGIGAGLLFAKKKVKSICS